MSDVCGRRRLAKLAFVTGASGNLRGFLEEPVHTNYNYRLTDPFAFHAAFLEERLRMQSSPTGDGVSAPVVQPNAQESNENPGEAPVVQESNENPDTNEAVDADKETNVPAVNAEGQNVNAKTAEEVKAAFDALKTDLSKFIASPDLLEALSNKLENKEQMEKFTEAWSKIEKDEQKRRIVERVESGSVIQDDGLEKKITPMTEMKGKVDNLVKRILGFENASRQAGLKTDKSTLLYTHKEKQPLVTFNVGNRVQEMIDGVNVKSEYLKSLMHKTMAAAIEKTVKVEKIPENTDGEFTVRMTKKSDEESMAGGSEVNVEGSFPDDTIYVKRDEGVVIEQLRAIRDIDGKIIAGLRAPPSASTINENMLFVGLCPNLSGYSPLAEAKAGGVTSKLDSLTDTAEKFFPNAFMNGIDLEVNLKGPWEFKVGAKDDIIFRIALSSLEGEQADVTKEKIVDDFNAKISGPEHEEVMSKLTEALKNIFASDDTITSIFRDKEFETEVPEEATQLRPEEAKAWNTAKEKVKGFLNNRVMVKPHKVTGVTDPVDFFTELSKSQSSTPTHSTVLFIGNLLSREFKATNDAAEDPQSK